MAKVTRAALSATRSWSGWASLTPVPCSTHRAGIPKSLVAGGDPMNGPLHDGLPEILKVSNVWDRLFLHSVQSRDVQLRFIF